MLTNQSGYQGGEVIDKYWMKAILPQIYAGVSSASNNFQEINKINVTTEYEYQRKQ